MPADSRTVFDIVSDVPTMDRWIPEEIEVQPIAPDLAVAEAETEGEGPDEDDEPDALLRIVPEQLRVEWGSRGRPDYTGWLQVMDQADGASEVVVHLSFLGDQPEAKGGRARSATQRLLEQSLERLAEEVTRRVTRTGS
jgi:hypothetical protein